MAYFSQQKLRMRYIRQQFKNIRWIWGLGDTKNII